MRVVYVCVYGSVQPDWQKRLWDRVTLSSVDCTVFDIFCMSLFSEGISVVCRDYWGFPCHLIFHWSKSVAHILITDVSFEQEK